MPHEPLCEDFVAVFKYNRVAFVYCIVAVFVMRACSHFRVMRSEGVTVNQKVVPFPEIVVF